MISKEQFESIVEAYIIFLMILAIITILITNTPDREDKKEMSKDLPKDIQNYIAQCKDRKNEIRNNRLELFKKELLKLQTDQERAIILKYGKFEFSNSGITCTIDIPDQCCIRIHKENDLYIYRVINNSYKYTCYTLADAFI